MPIQQSSMSRFVNTEPIVIKGVETFGLWKRPDELKIEDLNETDYYRLKIDQDKAGRPDLLADEIYGSSFLEWILVMFNRPKNPLGWPQSGSVILVPTKETVRKFI